MRAAITPSGVRDGDPAALAGLCAVRGPSVLAYCRHVAGDAGAGDAAADAFARFRAAVVETGDPTDLNPEALLIRATRAAAASHAPRAPQGVCADVPVLLAARADRSIAPDDLERLETHLESCWACRAPVARFEAAERAYRDPPDPVVDPAVVTQIVAAMAAAAPARGDDGGDAEPAAGVLPVAAESGDAGAAGDRPTTELRTLGKTLGSDDDPEVPAAADVRPRSRPPERPSRPGFVASLLGGRPRGGRSRPARGATPPAAVASTRTRQRDPARPPGSRNPRPRRSAAGASMVFVSAPASASARGRGRSLGGLPLPIVLPAAVVLVALLGALFISGVFGGSDPASSPRVETPSDGPKDTRPADVVVVPGAEDADADAVERAKARERARERRQRDGSVARTPSKKKEKEPAPAATPATAAPTQASSSPPPPPPPPPPSPRRRRPAAEPPPLAANQLPAPSASKQAKSNRGSRKVDAGKGATGAEQIPPAEDTSSVPDLAPAPQPSAPAP